ncbi:Tn7 transposase TnsA N-terminal domain-containing protein [Ramlibacter sp.]|uniref:Tn7 transposase TnsA N-terminal domain-containing protein n=1 Tax=Ramlibacter sp. TaxID=1917967 RepID=UPI002C5DD6CB|nr:Tn7 transposase TnsA N-terminal domain-containing protein [Ramlibacter sp.]HWI83486.1 Tn7 transposase TnsA N-terminal domain-containing protein [Ramlibacter sp.]
MSSTNFTAVAAAVVGTPASGGNLVVGPTRDPVRCMSGRSFRAKFSSVKNQRFIRCESLLEMHAMQMFELVSGVARYTEQPPALRLKMGQPARSSQYTPDIHVEWTGWIPWLVEVKPRQIAESERWQTKLSRAAMAAVRKGFHFVVLTEDHMRAAGMNDVRRALDSRKAKYVESLGDGATDTATYDPGETGEIESRVQKVLARAFEESPSLRLLRTPGIADPHCIADRRCNFSGMRGGLS